MDWMRALKRGRLLFLVCIVLVALGIFLPDSVRCESETEDSGYDYLLTITSPVAGYESTIGTIYDLLPVGVEFPVHERVGIALYPDLFYYEGDYQSLQVVAKVTIYSRGKTEAMPYGGFYAAPLLAGVYDLHGDGGALCGGADMGYTWQGAKTPWRFTIGLWYLSSLSFDDANNTGMLLELGRWF